jgi:hypothetical protein
MVIWLWVRGRDEPLRLTGIETDSLFHPDDESSRIRFHGPSNGKRGSAYRRGEIIAEFTADEIIGWQWISDAAD